MRAIFCARGSITEQYKARVWGTDGLPEKSSISRTLLTYSSLTTPNPHYSTPAPSLVGGEPADSATGSIISTMSNVTDRSPYSDGGFVDWRTWTLPPTGRGESRKLTRSVYLRPGYKQVRRTRACVTMHGICGQINEHRPHDLRKSPL